MAVNKNALIRYKVLDSCFRNPGRKYFIEDLIKECNKVLSYIDPESNGISLRQIRDDIKFMKGSEGWSIDLGQYYDGKKMYYRYVDLNFSINNMPLTDIEIRQMKSALGVFSQFSGIPQFDWIGQIIPKIGVTNTDEHRADTLVQFESNPYLRGIEKLGDLYSAIVYKKVLQVDYRPFDAEAPQILVFHPVFLKQFNSRWFIFGYNPESDRHDWILALDRIIAFKELNEVFRENEIEDWQAYFDDMIGVTKPAGATVEDILLHCFNKTAFYIESKPLHGSQKSKWIRHDLLEVKLKVLVNYELENLIMSYSDCLVVLKPQHLAEKIRGNLKSAMEKYEQIMVGVVRT